MTSFDPVRERALLQADTGVSMMLERSLEEARVERGITPWALGCFRELVKAALCDLDDDAAALLARARHWLEVAVRENERPHSEIEKDRDWKEAERFRVLGLCRWLMEREVDQKLFSSACDALTRYFGRQKDERIGVTYSFPSFILAGHYDEVLAFFGAFKWLAPPARPSGIKCPAKICYLFATHELSGDPDGSSLERSFRSFLKFMMPVCLGLRSGGFGVVSDVPVWTLLEEQYIGGVTRDGFENIRRALPYLQTAQSGKGSRRSGSLAGEARAARAKRERVERPRAGSPFARAVAAAGETALVPWPKSIELPRVVVERALLGFIAEILAEQAPSAPVGAVTLRPLRKERGKKVRALVYVGPLEQRTPGRINDLVQPNYSAAGTWDLDKLLKFATATAEQPLGY